MAIVIDKLDSDIDNLIKDTAEMLNFEKLMEINPMLKLMGYKTAIQNIRIAIGQLVRNRPDETLKFLCFMHKRLGEIVREHNN